MESTFEGPNEADATTRVDATTHAVVLASYMGVCRVYGGVRGL